MSTSLLYHGFVTFEKGSDTQVPNGGKGSGDAVGFLPRADLTLGIAYTCLDAGDAPVNR